MRFEPGRCFYCRCEFVKPSKGRLHDNSPTIDHVYPHRSKLPPGLRNRNQREAKVRCCHHCNELKAYRPPTMWLSMCPDPDGAADLAKLLLGWGVDAKTVEWALARRGRMA